MSALQAMTIAIAISVCISTALVFGVPYSDVLTHLDAGELAQRVLSAALFGAFAALSGVRLRMATLRTPPRA